jgi:hypothetical protein
MLQNLPGPVTCPHCHNPQAEILPPVGDRTDYRCPTCLDFSIAGSRDPVIEKGADLTAWQFTIGDQGRRFLVPLYAWECLGTPGFFGFSTEPHYPGFQTPNWKARGEFRGLPDLPDVSAEQIASYRISGWHLIVFRGPSAGAGVMFYRAGEWPQEVA